MLTAQEIEAADCIIVAADAQVPMDRFDGKRVIECQVSDGISKAPELLERAASGEVPVYHAASSGSSSPAKAASGGKSGSVGHQIYTQLMNGVSHMLPFVVGGGILIAIAFLIDGFSVDMNALPLDQRVNFGTITRWRHGLKMSVVWHLALCSRFWLVSSRWRSETARRWQSVLSAA